MYARESLREHYGLCGFEWECPDCECKNKKIEDIAEFADLAIRKLVSGDRENVLWLLDELYCKIGYQLPKEIIENLA
jgi:hypothetical protein